MAAEEDFFSGSGSIQGNEQATAQSKVPLGLCLNCCIGLGAEGQLVPVPAILAKVLQRSHTHSHQTKTVGLCIGLKALGASWQHSPLLLPEPLQLSHSIMKDCVSMHSRWQCLQSTASNDNHLGRVVSLRSVQTCVLLVHTCLLYMQIGEYKYLATTVPNMSHQSLW